MSDYTTSVIRTLSALIAGWLMSLPVLSQLDISSDQWVAGVAVVLAALYHVVIRLIETKHPKAGTLLGVARQPSYKSPVAIVDTAPSGAPQMLGPGS